MCESQFCVPSLGVSLSCVCDESCYARLLSCPSVPACPRARAADSSHRICILKKILSLGLLSFSGKRSLSMILVSLGPFHYCYAQLGVLRHCSTGIKAGLLRSIHFLMCILRTLRSCPMHRFVLLRRSGWMTTSGLYCPV